MFLHLSSTLMVVAQNKLWDKTIGGNGDDQLTSLQQTSDGGYILGGWSNSDVSGDKSGNSKGDLDYWIVKLKSDGTKEWDKTFGGENEDALTSLQQTADGGYILGGRSNSNSSIDKSGNSNGGFDYWVIKIKANGSKEWEKSFGTINNDQLTSLQQTSDGGYILGGFSEYAINGSNYEFTKNAWIVKITADGTKVWEQSVSSVGVMAVQQTRDGGFILGCSGADYRIIKLNVVGTKEWDKTYRGNDEDELKAIQQTWDGGYILGGYSWSGIGGDKSQANKGKTDYWVVKLNVNGLKEWDKTIGGQGFDDLASLQQTFDGNYILGGHSSSAISGDKTEARRNGCLFDDEFTYCGVDYWVVMLAPDGAIMWDKTVGGEGKEDGYWDDNLAVVRQTRDGNFILAGSSQSSTGSEKSEDNKGESYTSDFWVVKLKNSPMQRLIFDPILDKTLGEAPFTLSAKASSGLPVTFSVVSGPATVKGNVLTLTGTGTITVKASQKGNATYTPVEVTQTFLAEAAVPVKKQWDKTYGSNAEDLLTVVQQTSDGGYILGGDSDSFKSDDKSQGRKGEYDYWVIKLKPDGTKEWDRTFGGKDYDRLTAIVQTNDGGYILGGWSRSDKGGDKSVNSYGGADYWLVKIKANGAKDWDKTIGGKDDDYLTSLQLSNDGGYIFGGYSYSSMGGDKSEDAHGISYNSDYWILKFKADGTKEWDKAFGGDSDDELTSIHQTSDGSFILGGSSDSDISGDKTEPHYKSVDDFGVSWKDYWLVKIDAQGNKLWDKTIGGNEDDKLTSLQQTSDSGYILGGSSRSGISGDKTEVSKGVTDFWIVKLNANGNKIWDKTIGSATHDELTSVHQTRDGGYFLGGSSYMGFSGDKREASKGSTDYWIVKLNTTGKKEWDKTYGGKKHEELKSVHLSNDGSYMLGGLSSSNIGGDKSEDSRDAGLYESGDYWIIKITEEQPVIATWNMRYGGTGKDNLTTVIKTTDGGYLSGGYTNSGVNGDKSQSSQGQNDYWIVKSDKNGKKLWDKRYGGSGDDYLNRVIQTQDGGYLLAGSSFSRKSGDKSESSKGDRDFWVVKTDKQGNKQWDKTLGGSGYDELKKVIQLSTGEYVLGGYSNSPVSDDKSQNSQGSTDYWLIKISSTGTKIWDKRYGGSSEETLGSFTETKDSGFFLGGTSYSGKSGDKQKPSQGASDYWAVKTDKDGNLIWEKTFGGSGTDEVYSVRQISGNHFYLAGTSNSGKSGNKSQDNKGGKDYWLLTLDKNGRKIWDKTFGGSKDDELQASTYTSQGHYVLAGHSSSGVSGDKTQASQGESDYWVVEVDENGDKVQDQRYGGSGTEELHTVTTTKEGGLLLGGRSDSGVSGDRTQPSQGNTDYWLVKVAPETQSIVAARTATASLSTEASSPVKLTPLTAYPNPFQKKVNISFSLETNQAVHLEVHDSQGRKVADLFQGQAQANQTYQVEWQAKNQASGLYFLRLQTPDKIQHQKVLLSK